MIYPLYLNIPLVPSRSAMTELYDNNMDLNDVLKVIESGYDCPKSKRSKEKIERCIDLKQKTVRIVIAKSFSDYFTSEVWVVIHVGVTSKPKVRK